MFDVTDLDLRYRDHAGRVDQVNRAELPAPAERPRHGGPRVVAADVLLRVCHWLAPEEVTRVARGKTATT